MKLDRVVLTVASAVLAAACGDLQIVQPGGSGGSGGSSGTMSGTQSTSGAGASGTGSTGTGSTGAGASGSASSSGGPLLGYLTVGQYINHHQAGEADVSSFQATRSGAVGHLTVYYSSGGTTQLLVGLYDDLAGQPDHLLATGIIENPKVGAWNTAAVSPAAAVTQGTRYWIALLSPEGNGPFNFAYDEQAGFETAESASPTLASLPGPWSGSSQPLPGTLCSFYASP